MGVLAVRYSRPPIDDVAPCFVRAALALRALQLPVDDIALLLAGVALFLGDVALPLYEPQLLYVMTARRMKTLGQRSWKRLLAQL